MKKTLWIIGIVLLIALGWYLVSPLFNSIERNDVSPLVDDDLDLMDAETREEFDSVVDELSGVVVVADEEMNEGQGIISQGEFKPRAHEVEGKALAIDTGEERILRFENFETVNGPELRIYLSTDLGDEDIIDLGKIKATKGNVNYEIPEGVDLDKYNKVLVWCKPFRVLFSYSELK